ncbi:hypothetical protein LXL04_038129 [Taraxacum kok-saghyz]
MKRFLQELGFMQKQYVVLCDNESVIHLAKNSMYHKRTKHIDVRYHWIRDCLEDKMFELEKVHTNDNGSDMLTKALARENHYRERNQRKSKFLAFPFLKIYRQCFAFFRRSNGPFTFVFGQHPHDIKAFLLSGWIAHFCSGGSEIAASVLLFSSLCFGDIFPLLLNSPRSHIARGTELIRFLSHLNINLHYKLGKRGFVGKIDELGEGTEREGFEPSLKEYNLIVSRIVSFRNFFAWNATSFRYIQRTQIVV